MLLEAALGRVYSPARARVFRCLREKIAARDAHEGLSWILRGAACRERYCPQQNPGKALVSIPRCNLFAKDAHEGLSWILRGAACRERYCPQLFRHAAPRKI